MFQTKVIGLFSLKTCLKQLFSKHHLIGHYQLIQMKSILSAVVHIPQLLTPAKAAAHTGSPYMQQGNTNNGPRLQEVVKFLCSDF